MTAGERRHTSPISPAATGAVVVVAQREVDARVRAADADDRVLVGIVERGAEPDAGFGARVARRERARRSGGALLRRARA